MGSIETAPAGNRASAQGVLVAASEALAVAALQVGFGLMTIAAVSDTLFALTGGGGVRAAVEGTVLIAIAVAGLLRPSAAARLLRPRGRVLVVAIGFALVGAADWGLQSHFAEVAPAIVWIAVIVCSPPWVAACVLASAIGYVADLMLHTHSATWVFTTSAGNELVANQVVDLVANAGAVLILVALLRRFVGSTPAMLEAVRGYGPAITPRLGEAARGKADALLPRAHAEDLLAALTDAERDVLRALASGLAPKQVAHERSLALATVRSHVAAAKRKTGARTIEQLAGLYAEAGRAS